MSNKALGKWGENQAARHLKKQGYRILKRNLKVSRGEIDIVASKDNVLVFIEVKSQEGKGPVAPEVRVGYSKQKQISKLAKHYLQRSKGQYDEIRMDVISVYRLDGRSEIQHIEGAFGAVE